MSRTWFVVLSQSSMKLFRRNKARQPLKHFRTLANGLVSLRGKELTRHKPGAVAKGGRGSRHSVLNSGVRPHDLMVKDFAHKIATYLDGQRKIEQFEELLVAAEPKFMGLLKKELAIETKKLVRTWLRKDLEKADTDRLSVAFAKA